MEQITKKKKIMKVKEEEAEAEVEIEEIVEAIEKTEVNTKVTTEGQRVD